MKLLLCDFIAKALRPSELSFIRVKNNGKTKSTNLVPSPQAREKALGTRLTEYQKAKKEPCGRKRRGKGGGGGAGGKTGKNRIAFFLVSLKYFDHRNTNYRSLFEI